MKMSNDVTNVIEEPKCRFDRRVYKYISTASVDSLFIIFSYSLELVQAKMKKKNRWSIIFLVKFREKLN